MNSETNGQKQVEITPPSFIQAFWFWLKLGFISFGGPAGQIAVMQRELVERKRWISPDRFGHALSFCMVLPGPEAQQLATYIGWLLHGVRGAVVAGGLFVLPAWFMLVGLSWLFVAQGHTPWMGGVLLGLNAAVAALIVHAVWRLASRVLKPQNTPNEVDAAKKESNRLLVTGYWCLAAIGLIVMLTGIASFFWVVAVAAAVGFWLAKRAERVPVAHGKPSASALGGPRHVIHDDAAAPSHTTPSMTRLAWVVGIFATLWAAPMLALWHTRGASDPLTQMAILFTKAALVTFGGAYAVLPYVSQAAVEQFGWLSHSQMMAGLALGESTPGPLILVVAYVGFVGAWTTQVLGPNAMLAGAVAGAAVAAWFTFLPSFAFILGGGPWVEATRQAPRWAGPLGAISAAVVGVMASLAVTFIAANLGLAGVAPLFGLMLPKWALATSLSVLALLALWRFQRSALEVVLVCAALGWLLT